MPLDLFESFAVSSEELPKALLSVKSRRHISEAVILSTCNRTELYVFAEKFHGAYQDARDFFSDLADLPPDEFNDYLYVHYENEAVRHLFSVTCGLDSAVTGENEIQHQVKVAWQKAQLESTCGPTINAVFRRALEVGKRVRTETNLTKQAPSIARAVIEMAEENLKGLEEKNILILGAGEMGEGMANALSELETGKITFANRNLEKAKDLSKKFGGEVIEITHIPSSLKQFDCFISSTAAAHTLFSKDDLSDHINKPLLIIDIAIPRDIDQEVTELSNVVLLDMEDLQTFVEPKRKVWESDIGKSRSLISEETNRFLDQQSARKVAPLIAEFREGAEEIRQTELKRYEGRLESFTDEQRDLIELITQGMLGKILHDPTVSLNEAAGSPRGERLADALRELFNL